MYPNDLRNLPQLIRQNLILKFERKLGFLVCSHIMALSLKTPIKSSYIVFINFLYIYYLHVSLAPKTPIKSSYL